MTDMTGAQLRAWIDYGQMSKRKAARILDISDRRMEHFLKDEVRIPTHISLACAALHIGLKPYHEKC